MQLLARHRSRALLATLLLLSFVPTLGWNASAHAGDRSGHGGHGRHSPTIEVATYNLYLGANLDAIFTATTVPELTQRAGEVYASVEATDFPERAGAIADQIVADTPDVVGLQEVALWEKGPIGGELEVTYDFLDILVTELADRGVPYRAVATNQNFDGTLPISATEQARFRDRDVIIVRADREGRKLRVSNPRSGTYAAALEVPTAIPGVTFTSPRGWSTVEVSTHRTTLTVANTHLEAAGPATIRNAQAEELLEIVAGKRSTVILGDLNSRPSDTTGAYGILTGAGFTDAWLATGGDPAGGLTAGQTPTLLDPQRLNSRIDYVLTKPGKVRPVSTEVIGDEDDDRSSPSGFWPSDHAGVLATIRLGC